jgi:hypothetical protein
VRAADEGKPLEVIEAEIQLAPHGAADRHAERARVQRRYGEVLTHERRSAGNRRLGERGQRDLADVRVPGQPYQLVLALGGGVHRASP